MKVQIFFTFSRGCFNEEELEQKFTSLALAFAIDASTTKDRCERQKRYRNQTELNLSKEIYTFKEKLALMHPLCTDYEKAELLSALFSQVPIQIIFHKIAYSRCNPVLLNRYKVKYFLDHSATDLSFLCRYMY